MAWSRGLAAVVLVLVIAISGCSSATDVTQIAKSLPEVDRFLADHPGAEIKAVLWPEAAVQESIDAIRTDCGGPVPVKSYFRVAVSEGATQLVLWLDPATNQPACVIKVGGASASQPGQSAAGATNQSFESPQARENESTGGQLDEKGTDATGPEAFPLVTPASGIPRVDLAEGQGRRIQLETDGPIHSVRVTSIDSSGKVRVEADGGNVTLSLGEWHDFKNLTACLSAVEVEVGSATSPRATLDFFSKRWPPSSGEAVAWLGPRNPSVVRLGSNDVPISLDVARKDEVMVTVNGASSWLNGTRPERFGCVWATLQGVTDEYAASALVRLTLAPPGGDAAGGSVRIFPPREVVVTPPGSANATNATQNATGP